jgi:hypothetical protein
MEPSRLLARYHPAARTLEFDLAEAPLVEAVLEVSVLSTTCVPDPESPAMQKGLFYGKDTFLFDEPFVFDHDETVLMCWVRLRECSATALRAWAADTLRCCEESGNGEILTQERDCLVVLRGDSLLTPGGTGPIYLATPHTPDHRRTVSRATALSAAPPPSTPPLTNATADSTVLSISAAALCFDT